MGIMDDNGHLHVLLGYIREGPLSSCDQYTDEVVDRRSAYHVDHLIVPSGQQVPPGRVPCLKMSAVDETPQDNLHRTRLSW